MKNMHILKGLRAGEDSIAGKRSHAFTVYLQTLPEGERDSILRAEREYVGQIQSPTSTEQSALQDFNESMLGLSENYPHPSYRVSEGPIFLSSKHDPI